jgi:nucleoside-diphosphate-sugar epimerase
VKIAITGANGFVGSRLTRYLINQGHEVIALVRSTADVSLLPIKSQINTIDYSSIENILNALDDCQILIHCAAVVRALNWQDMHEQNTILTERITEAVNKSDAISQFIFLSSQAAAGMGEKHKPKTEEDIAQPITWYGKSKLMAEEIIRSRCLTDWTIIRPVSVYGPGDKDFLQTFKLMKKHISVALGIKDKYLSLIYVDELCALINLSLNNPAAAKQVFFASDGEIYTHRMFCDALQAAGQTISLNITIPDALLFPIAVWGEAKSHWNKKSEILNLQKFKEFKGRYWTVSMDKAFRLLGYKPNANLTKNLHATWIWYKEQGWL